MRSAWRPAALTTYPALMVPAEVRTAPPTRPQYAAPARVQAAGGFLLYEGDAGARVPVVQLARHREADDTAADDEEIRDPRDAAVGAAGIRRGVQQRRRRAQTAAGSGTRRWGCPACRFRACTL